jgi:hypothetical protein
MPVIPSDIPPVPSPGQGIEYVLKEDERVQNSVGIIIGKYFSDEEHGLGLPASLALFDHESQQFVVAKPEAAKSNM